MAQAQKKRRGRKRGELSIPKWITPEMVTWLSKKTNVNLEEKINLFNEFVQDAQEINRGQTNKRGPDRIIAYEKALSKTKKTLDILKSAFADQEIKKSFHRKFDVPMHKINSFHQKIKRRYRKYRSDHVWAKKRAKKVGEDQKTQEPQEEDIMVFTLAETEQQVPGNQLASAIPKKREKRKPTKAAPELSEEWISENSPEYKKLKKQANEYREEAEDAEEDVLFFANNGRLYQLRKSLDRLFKNRHLEIETERKLAKELKALSRKFSEKPGLKKQAEQTKQSCDDKTLFPFSKDIRKIMDKIDYSYHRKKRVRGGNPLQEEMKRHLFKEAKKVVNQYKRPPNEVLKIMDTIKDAAYDENVDDVEMLSLVTGIEPDEEEFSSILVAVRGAAKEAAREEGVKLAKAMKKKGGPKA